MILIETYLFLLSFATYVTIFTVPLSLYKEPDSKPVALVGRSVSVILVARNSPGVLSCAIKISNARIKSAKYCCVYSTGGSGNRGGGI